MGRKFLWAQKKWVRHFFGVKKKIWVGNFLGSKNLCRKFFFGQKNLVWKFFLGKKNVGWKFFWVKKMWVGNFVGSKKMWVGNYFGSKRNLVGNLCRKLVLEISVGNFFGSKKICVGNLFVSTKSLWLCQSFGTTGGRVGDRPIVLSLQLELSWVKFGKLSLTKKISGRIGLRWFVGYFNVWWIFYSH